MLLACCCCAVDVSLMCLLTCRGVLLLCPEEGILVPGLKGRKTDLPGAFVCDAAHGRHRFISIIFGDMITKRFEQRFYLVLIDSTTGVILGCGSADHC